MTKILTIIGLLSMCFTAHANDCRTTIVSANSISGKIIGVNDFSSGKNLSQVLSEHGITIENYRTLGINEQVPLFLMSSSIQEVASMSLTDLQIFYKSKNDISTEKREEIKRAMNALISCM